VEDVFIRFNDTGETVPLEPRTEIHFEPSDEEKKSFRELKQEAEFTFEDYQNEFIEKLQRRILRKLSGEKYKVRPHGKFYFPDKNRKF
jgi:Mor family transcriptional regulator